MPFIDRPGYRIFYSVTGDPAAAPLILSHSLGATSALWDPQLAAFSRRFRVILYDHPGHGRSPNRPAGGNLADYGKDVIALMDELGIGTARFCGLSLGGMVGIQLGAAAGERFTKLVLCSTTARIEDPTLLTRRVEQIRRDGLARITGSVVDKWLTEEFRARNPDALESVRTMFGTTTDAGYADTAEMICAMDLRPGLGKITNETLVIYGSRDEATPPAWNLAVADGIGGARSCRLDGAHLINVEAPQAFAEEVLNFLA